MIGGAAYRVPASKHWDVLIAAAPQEHNLLQRHRLTTAKGTPTGCDTAASPCVGWSEHVHDLRLHSHMRARASCDALRSGVGKNRHCCRPHSDRTCCATSGVGHNATAQAPSDTLHSCTIIYTMHPQRHSRTLYSRIYCPQQTTAAPSCVLPKVPSTQRSSA